MKRLVVAIMIEVLAVAWPASAAPGDQIWTKRFIGGTQFPKLARSPDGTKVFVAGTYGSGNPDFLTVAYNASTGSRLWVDRYNGPANRRDGAVAVEVSPDSNSVYVTGNGYGQGIVTFAYDAATGSTKWMAVTSGDAASLAVSPDGTRVYVTGESRGASTGDEYATAAYDASTGDELWAKRYDDPLHSDDAAQAVAVSPGGGRVFVTGRRTTAQGSDYHTIAYRASTGAELWGVDYTGPVSNGSDSAFALGVSPGGSRVFVTGSSWGSSTRYDYATVAYNASSGAQVWASRYDGPGVQAPDSARDLVVSPDGTRIYVTGESQGLSDGYDYATWPTTHPPGLRCGSGGTTSSGWMTSPPLSWLVPTRRGST